MKTRKEPHVGVVMWLNQDYGRRVLTGILDYAATHGFGPVDLFDAQDLPGRPHAATPIDGWITVLGHNERVRFQALPGVKVQVPHLSAPSRSLSVATDSSAVGRAAAGHLLSLGLRHLVALPVNEYEAFAQLLAGFRQAAEAAGARVCEQRGLDSNADWAAWIAGLPTPCGILAQRDNCAARAVKLVRAAKLRVPEDIAVMGVGNDTIYCMTQRPTLTSVAVPAEHLGWLAASTLDKQLTAGDAESIAVPPSGVVVRQSTQMVAAADPAVVYAVRFMRRNLAHHLDIGELAKQANVSRRTLEQRFSRCLGRSICQEMNRIRLEQALSLLGLTTAPLKQVSTTVGFAQQANFTRFIREQTGLTPSQYRRRHHRRR